MGRAHNSMPESNDPAKRFGRRTTLKMLGLTLTGSVVRVAGAPAEFEQAQAARPAVKRDPATRPRGRAWRLRPLATGTTPRAFSATEFAALGALVDVIIPDTDTPGARAAGVHWYLDDVAGADARARDQWRAGLGRIDSQARATHGRPFAELSEPKQIAMLTPWAAAGTADVKVDNAGQPQVTGGAATDAVTPDDRTFFAFARAQTVDAYYKSEMGQIGELEWVGHEFNDEFPGRCTHPDPLVHPRPRWPRSRG